VIIDVMQSREEFSCFIANVDCISPCIAGNCMNDSGRSFLALTVGNVQKLSVDRNNFYQ